MASQSDLELVLLGIVAKFGPCTPYAVRQHFEASPSHFFSGSTGSIYPAVKRLADSGLLAPRAGRRGQQRRTLYAITPSGRAALRAWLAPPLDDAALGTPYDPLRTRVYFLTEINAKERQRFLNHAIEGLEQRLKTVRAYAEGYDPETESLSYLAARGYLYAARAQLRWLREVRREVEEAK